MSGLLSRIVADKKAHLAAMQALTPMGLLCARARGVPPPKDFAGALKAKQQGDRFALIAEIKKASPSAGLIRADFDPPALARIYAAAGAACLSVLTDERYFDGRDAFVAQAKAAANLPVLRKDFTLDPYQVAEARAIGADAVLLILAILEDSQAAELMAAAEEWRMAALVEVHDARERDRALRLGAKLIGINNRNLDTLKVDTATAPALAADCPADIHLVAESGLRSHADLQRTAQAGIHSFLVGESLLRQPDVLTATRALLFGADA